MALISYSSTANFSMRSWYGHGGIFLGRDVEFMHTQARKTFRLLGGNSSPARCLLLINGLKTLEVHMDRHCHNAMEVAGYAEHILQLPG